MSSYKDEMTLNVLFESVPDALVIVNQNGEIVDTNAQAEKLFGYSHDEMVGKPIELLVPAAMKGAHAKYRDKYLHNPQSRFMGSRLSLMAAHKNGGNLPVDISLNPMQGFSEIYIIAAIRDISEIIRVHEQSIQGWSRAMDFRDRETENHTQRVAQMTVKLAEKLGMSSGEIARAKQGALLHDIGKIAIPDHILLKPDKLTEGEWGIMRKHPEYALEMLWPINFLRPTSLDIPYCHHEKWDGTGYPRGLRGDDIPFSARIFAVIDVWDSLSYDRPYRKAWSQEKVIAYIQEQSGQHFEPRIVDVFCQMLAEEDGEWRELL